MHHSKKTHFQLPLLLKSFLNKRLSSRGFTLLEVLAASFILGITYIGVNTMFTTAFGLMGDARDVSIASHLIETQIETLRSQEFATVSIQDTTIDYSANLRAGEGNLVVSFDLDSNIKKVSMTVTWDDIRGNSVSRSVATLITLNGNQ